MAVGRGTLIAVGAVGGGAALAAAFTVGAQVRAAQPVPAVTVTAPASPAPSASPDTDWSALAAGDCVQDADSAWQQAYRVVPCTERHAAQVSAVVPLDDARRPSDEEVVGRLSLRCAAEPGSATAYTWPSAAEWDSGVRLAVCFALPEAA